jgi:hypothetical protein
MDGLSMMVYAKNREPSVVTPNDTPDVHFMLRPFEGGIT